MSVTKRMGETTFKTILQSHHKRNIPSIHDLNARIQVLQTFEDQVDENHEISVDKKQVEALRLYQAKNHCNYNWHELNQLLDDHETLQTLDRIGFDKKFKDWKKKYKN